MATRPEEPLRAAGWNGELPLVKLSHRKLTKWEMSDYINASSEVIEVAGAGRPVGGIST
jgi:hypothetical protein